LAFALGAFFDVAVLFLPARSDFLAPTAISYKPCLSRARR
jgi:hypothetical protein